ncbi:MAG: DNA gyrase/topoisomerase IV subunit A [Cytophagaceae bacterium]|nr:DNA gyrase/topoisomerase IV subunit A [Cytophagaceae bacterium]MDW8456403.1 DNA gyrase/topoisomerase IV subunit A [Cytophagaceae bacterium]
MDEPSQNNTSGTNGDNIHDIIPVSGLYESWFLDYASYVILERAVPALSDGFKPVQRRIMHAMKEMDDGRFNKVANIIGATMQYHPHGDASISEAIINLGQKELLFDTQGNWGDVRTGDSAAAPRYIEARLSKFALEVVFNDDTTEWQLSYDGRKREPVTLPVKFPLLLAQGVEGIAVGLSTKILPHNFCELIQASIAYLKNKKFELYPDFSTGGMIDVSQYNDGQRGGRIRCRARIIEKDKKTLLITEIPYGTTTTALIDSIVKASDAGKIKIKKVTDNTAKEVEIEIQLQPGTDPDITIDALYAFTDCELSISTNACVIINDKPHFVSVSDILKACTEQTKELLRRELQIRKKELMEKIFFGSLLKIFISKGMYKHKDYEDAGSFEQVTEVLNTLFKPYFKQFYRAITPEDYRKLIEKPMSSITRFDLKKADEAMKQMQEEINQVDHHLANLTEYTISWYEGLMKKYGKGKERKTEIRTFDNISAVTVAANNQKLYVNRAEGFFGYGMKKDEYVCDCSDIDDIIVITKEGKCVVKKIGEKVFAGKDIIHIGVFRKGDDRMVYNLIYMDGTAGAAMVKRFQILGVTRDREYDLTKGAKGSKVYYLTANPNGEAEIVTVTLSQSCSAKIKVFDFDFASIAIKGRDSQGNILTKYPIKKITLKAAGKSTLGGVSVFYDSTIGRLNNEGKGKHLGTFHNNDLILAIYKNGTYELTGFELTNRYEPNDVLLIEKYNPEHVITAVYFDGESSSYYVKRFKLETQTVGKKFLFISESSDSKLELVTTEPSPVVELHYAKSKNLTNTIEKVELDKFIEVRGWKAVGNKLSSHKILSMKFIPNPSKETYNPGATLELDLN